MEILDEPYLLGPPVVERTTGRAFRPAGGWLYWASVRLADRLIRTDPKFRRYTVENYPDAETGRQALIWGFIYPSLQALNGRPEDISVIGEHNLAEAYALNRGVVIASAHHAGINAASAFFKQRHYPVTAPAKRVVIPVTSNGLAVRVMRWRSGAELVPAMEWRWHWHRVLHHQWPMVPDRMRKREAYAELRRALAAGRMVIEMVDILEGDTSHSLIDTICGRPRRVSTGFATLALRSGSPIVPGIAYYDFRDGRIKTVLRFLPPITNPEMTYCPQLRDKVVHNFWSLMMPWLRPWFISWFDPPDIPQLAP